MTKIEGIPVQGGLSIGPIHFLHRKRKKTVPLSRTSPREELLRFEAAKERAFVELRRLQARVAAHLGNDAAAIFLFQTMILEDEDYLNTVYSYINDASTAEQAVARAERDTVAFFGSLSDSYMRARAVDARDLSRRLDGILTESEEPIEMRHEALILVSAPADADAGAVLQSVSEQLGVKLTRERCAVLCADGADPAAQPDDFAYVALLPGSGDVAQLARGVAGLGDRARLDFSIVNDMHYYNGMVFKGYISGAPAAVLSGGQYDRLMRRLGRSARAIGFAVYLSALELMLYEKPASDVDTLLVYDAGDDPAAVAAAMKRLIAGGGAVRAQLRGEPAVTSRRRVGLDGQEVRE